MKSRCGSILTRISESLRPGSPSEGRVSEPIRRMFVGWPGSTGLVAARALRASGVLGAACSSVSSR